MYVCEAFVTVPCLLHCILLILGEEEGWKMGVDAD